MRSLRFVFLILWPLLSAITPTLADDAKNDAPLGLAWGMSSAQVRAMNVLLKDAPMKDYGTSFSATQLPKMINDVETVVLSFGYDDKLWRIADISKVFSNDPHGTATLNRYDEIAQALSEKYGRGTQHHQYDANQFMKGGDFLYKIKVGEAWHYTDYHTDLLDVQLILGAASSSDGYYRIIFENKPLSAGFAKGKKGREKDAL
jgi:hypothetical protein